MHSPLLRHTLTRLLLGGSLLMPAATRAQATTRTTTKSTAKSTAKSKAAAKSSTSTRAKSATGTASAARGTAKASQAAGGASLKSTSATATVAGSIDAAATGALAPSVAIALRDAPDGRPLATLSPQSTLVPLAHDRGWVRVRAEGWVKETEVSPTDPARVTLSAADLRADPDGARGKVVRWDVEVLAMETADPLRKGLNPDEPYLLARGPGSESALLYVAIPPGLLAAARTVASVAPTPVTLVATVRTGRSEPVGVPVLDAQSLVRR